MRIFTRLLLVALLAGLATQLPAQSANSEDRMIVVTFTDKDGARTVIKKRLDEQTKWEDELQRIKQEEGSPQDLEIRIVDANAAMAEPRTMIFIRHAEKAGEKAGTCTTKVTWQEKEGHEGHQEHKYNYNFNFDQFRDRNADGERPLLGIYPANVSGALTVEGLVDGGGAQAAGLETGDIITAINGVTVSNSSELRTELNKNKVGQAVSVSYLRNGQPAESTVTLGASRSDNRRDPCKVFIGVNVGGRAEDGGVRVNSVIDGTAAEKYGVADGDVILALDGVSVNSFGELLTERNKHKPGDWFNLSILRKDQLVEVDAQFNKCDEEAVEPPVVDEPELVEEVYEKLADPIEIQESQPSLAAPDNSLQMKSWRVFPNPTFGRLRVQFQTEALPTQVSIVDVNGKVVYERNLPQFDGYFDNEVDLSNATPGAYFLKVIQEGKVRSEKLILMPRA